MAKGIYVGAPTLVEGVISGDIIPKEWTLVTEGTEYVASDGTKLRAGDTNTNYPVVNACDGNKNSHWQSELSNVGYVEIEFPKPIKITKMNTMIWAVSSSNLISVKVQGSTTGVGTTWIDLYTTTEIQSTSSLTEITLNNTAEYKFYRIYYTMSNATARLSEWQVSEYIGLVESTTGVAHKVKKAYIGVDSKARKIKKGYIGVGGVARPFFSAEQKLMYYGTATNLSATRISLAATSIGDYALFAGGTKKGADACSAVVDTYSPTLVKGTATNLSKARQRLAATTVGDYALIGGGYGTGGTYTYMSSKVVDTYTSTLAKGTATALSKERADLAATTVGDYALFGGGEYSDSSGKNNYQQIVDTYSSTLAKGTATTLSSLGSMRAATTVGDYAIFAGGYVYQSSKAYFYSTVDAYSSSLVKKTATALSTKKADLVATTVGDHALFAGGYNDSARLATVETYTKDLVKGTVADLSNGKSSMAATTVGDYALIAGGYNSSALATVDTYTKDLVKGTTTDLSVARCGLAATTVGDYALFGGGGANFSTTTANKYATVDVYQLV